MRRAARAAAAADHNRLRELRELQLAVRVVGVLITGAADLVEVRIRLIGCVLAVGDQRAIVLAVQVTVAVLADLLLLGLQMLLNRGRGALSIAQ